MDGTWWYDDRTGPDRLEQRIINLHGIAARE